MMVSSFLRAWAVLGEERYRAFAFKALDRVLATMFNQDTGMAHYTDMRNQVSDRNLVSGFLTDQVYMVRALLDAYAAGGERRCLTTAEKLTVLAKRRLLDVDGGGFWDTAPDEKSSGNLALRRKSLAHNAVAADSLRRLWIITGNREYRELQQRTLLSFAEAYEGVGFQTGIYAQAVADFLGHPVQMVVVGPLRQGRTQALLRACASFYDPRKVVAPLDTEEDAKRIAELGYRAASGASVYICVDKVCSAPVSDPEELPVSARKFVERNLGTR
jgi:uncharacterized protein YyaL (SSP411 family)